MMLTGVVSLVVLGQVVLPGSQLGHAVAQEKSHLIVVAEPGRYDFILGSGPHLTMVGLELKPSRILKGKVRAGELKRLSVTATGPETLPMKGGNTYIYYVYEFKGHPHILKVMAATEENIKTATKAVHLKESP